MGRHLDWETIFREIVGGRFERQTLEQLFEHIVGHCEGCRASLEAFLEHRPGAEYSALFLRLLPRLEEDRSHFLALREDLERDLASLLSVGPEERSRRIRRSHSRLKNPLLVDGLLAESRRAVLQDPAVSSDLARTAEEIALALPYEPYGSAWVTTCLARARAYRGNALRAQEELAEAEHLIDLARESFFAQGTGDPMVAAEILGFVASLRKDQHRLDEARLAAEEAVELCRPLGEVEEMCRMLVKVSVIYCDLGCHAEGLAAIEEAMIFLSWEEEPVLFLSALHNRGRCLIALGRLREARDLLEQSLVFYERLGLPFFTVRLRWLLGILAQGQGRAEEAESLLGGVRRTFLDDHLMLDAALAGLDLAQVLAKLRKANELRSLTDQIVPVLEASGRRLEAEKARHLLFGDGLDSIH